MTKRSETRDLKKFNLRLWFGLASLTTILLICIIAATLMSKFMTTNLLLRENTVSEEFLENIIMVDPNGQRAFEDDLSKPLVQSEPLLDFSRHILSIPGTIRVNIYARTGRILWSTESTIAGQVFPDNEEMKDAFNGHSRITYGPPDAEFKEEHQGLADGAETIIEAYIPVRANAGRGDVIGVVEMYKVPESLKTVINEGILMIWVGSAVAALILFGALYWIVQRGALVIQKQQNDLSKMEAFAAIGQMSSAVAHSLRNPMAAIRSSAELWRYELPPERREVVADVIHEIDRMDSYVKDLLTYARTEPYQLQPTDPRTIFETTLLKLDVALHNNRIHVTRLDRRQNNETVAADPMLLEQAITSIVTNAIEAMPGGGKLGVAIGPGPARGTVRLIVADNGSGIQPDFLDRISESYFTTKVRGLGLGVILARRIIERFGGSISWVRNRYSGTSVLIDLKAIA